MKDLISIIVPIYNAEQYIERCVKSILEQTYKNIEILLIDDGSTDNTIDRCKKLQEKDQRIKLIVLETNRGVSTARNIGIQNAKGELIGFVDSDDYIEKDMYSNLYNEIKNRVDLSICSVTNVEQEMVDNENTKISVIGREQFYNQVLGKSSINGYVHNKLFKKEIIQRNNIRFDTNIYICEDLLFVCEYMRYGQNVSINSNKMYHYIKNSNSAYNRKFDSRWKTVLDAYDRLFEIYSEQSIKNMAVLKYTYITVCSDILFRENKSKYFSEDERMQIKVRMNQYLKESLKNKEIKFKHKIKAFIYAKFPYLIGNLKIILKK